MMPTFRFLSILTSGVNAQNYNNLVKGNEDYRKCTETAIALRNSKQKLFSKEFHSHCEMA